MYRFLYDRDLHHERVKGALCFIIAKMKQEKHLYLQEKMRNEKSSIFPIIDKIKGREHVVELLKN